jgi:hypothetical protein
MDSASTHITGLGVRGIRYIPTRRKKPFSRVCYRAPPRISKSPQECYSLFDRVPSFISQPSAVANPTCRVAALNVKPQPSTATAAAAAEVECPRNSWEKRLGRRVVACEPAENGRLD